MNLSSLISPGHGIPDLRALGSHVYARFEVRQLKNARVLWLNEGWFMQSGVDVFDPAVRGDVCRMLLADYGVTASADDAAHTLPARRSLYADRYGGSGGAAHGGSGRCGAWGLFNGKGIGRTPLTPPDVDWEHGHGHLWLSEALREVVGAEIAAAELPHGAVPVIALIDTGIDFRKSDDNPPQRRAILVRPNFVRPAHFERSIYFGDAGSRDSSQYLDTLRVKEAIAAITGDAGRDVGVQSLENMFLRFAAQIGAARAHRLWQGRFLSSNMSVDGAMVDFGSFRAVANWRRAFGAPGESFGNETAHLRAAVESLCFYFKKFGRSGAPVPGAKLLLADLERATDKAFRDTAIDALGIDRSSSPQAAADLEQLVWAYYQRQQRETVAVDDANHLRLKWVYELLRRERPIALRATHQPKEAVALARFLRDELPNSGPPPVSLATARRWFRPRLHMLYNVAARGARLRADRLTGESHTDVGNISRYIATQLSRNRRHWPLLPRHLDVLGQVSAGYCAALYCRDRNSGESAVWLEGRMAADRWCVFGTAIAEARLETPLHKSTRGAGTLLSGAQLDMRAGGEIVIGGASLRIPPAVLAYDAQES